MTRYHLINGEKVVFTAEEETARDAEEAAYATEKAANGYKDKRAEKYPSITEQLDQLYRDMKSGKLGVGATTGEWYVGITSVKTLFPKS